MSNAITHQAEVNFKNEYFDTNNLYPGETLLKTLDFCFSANIPVPKWAQFEYRKCFKKYGNRLGEFPLVFAFNTDIEAGTHRKAKRKKEQSINTVYHLFMYFHTVKKIPIDNELYSKIATTLDTKGVKGSTVRDWYLSDIKPMQDSGVIFPLNMRAIKKLL